MRYLLDTNTITFWLVRGDRKVQQRAEAFRPQIGLSAIVLHELAYGAFNGKRTEETLNVINSMLLPVVPFEDQDARAAGRVRAVLRRAGTPIGAFDVLLAGQAQARDLTVVTNNVREFSRVDGLKLEDWTA